MKPLSIHLKNVGPFVDESLDFTQLEEVFLLCGDTGAGKTTIFDAMTFALYGDFLGARKGKAMDFRSQFAKEDEDSSVELEFSSDGEKYRVVRTLPRPYVNRNKKASVEASKLTVEKWNESLSSYEFLNAGKSELEAMLVKIVGLSAPEFSKIVVLPQGEFSKFLRSNSSVKQEILKKLFPIDFYQSIVEKVKKKNEDLQGKIDLADAEIKNILKEVNLTDAENKIASYESRLDENKTLLTGLHKEKERLDKANAKLEAELKTASELEKSMEEKKKLDEKTSSMKELENKLNLSDSADLVVPFVESKNQRRKEMEVAEKRLAEIKEMTEAAENKFNSLKKNEAENQKIEKLIDENKILFKGYADRLEAAEKYAEEEKLLEKSKEKLAEAKKSLDSENVVLKNLEKEFFEKAREAGIPADEDSHRIFSVILEKYSKAKESHQAANHICSLVEQISGLELKISDSEKSVKELNFKKDESSRQIENSEKLLAEYKNAREEQAANNAALSIVSYLKPGCPCPVCGSKEHPSPAKASGEFLDLDEKISTAERSIKTETELRASYSEKIAAETKLAEKYREDISVLKKESGDISLDLAKEHADKAKAEMDLMQKLYESCDRILKDIENSRLAVAELKDLVSQAESDFASVSATLKALENQVKKNGGENTDPASIRSEMKELEFLLEKQQDQVSSFKKDFEEAGLNLEKNRTRLQEAQDAFETSTENFKDAESVLCSRLVESEFEDEKKVLECFLEKSEKDSLKAVLKKFLDEMSRLETSIQVLSGKVSEKYSQLQEKSEKLEQEIESVEEKINTVTKEGENLLAEKTIFDKNFGKYLEKTKELAELEQEGKPLARLSKDLSGLNPSKVPFETWFLGLYFDDVVVCANRHLLKISGERYEFILDTDKSGGNMRRGLDLLVHDYQTNKDRDSAMLSGGETFMASISLALGLTEVVQKTSRMDSLFIDEGFGSLDKDCLEMSVGVLQDIGNTRTVGIISHVEEMMDAIACHVKVTKSDKGSHILL
ncbi:AAA family ATPase [Treponema sp.]|uniref:AAA family ATPase n=1 Tax=Treponema sp. TaxID=166 RepID=UPI00298DF92E|nr:AAA family ATPase [Treponema sp.]MCQ2242058.1 AAA family ATPase [Treponema sp.]